jgi:palmitoyltransferase ZDHHC9/14/18
MLPPYLTTRERHGKYFVFCNGRIFVGPDWRIMVMSVVLITVGTLLFVFYTNEITAARVIVGLSASASVVSLLVCGLSDPGIKPRGEPPSLDASPHDPRWRERVYIDKDGTPHRTRVEVKWCYSCNNYRPYRGVHCRYCDACVTRRDHHCPWTGTCIGARNYRSYFALVWFLSIMLLTAFIGGIHNLVRRSIRFGKANASIEDGPSGFTAALIDTYGIELALILLSFVFGFLSVSLALHHTYLITQNLTSGDVAKELPENVFTYGSVLANMWVVLTGCNEEERDSVQAEVVIEAGDSAAGDEPSTSLAPTPSGHETLCDDGGAVPVGCSADVGGV